MQYEKNLTLINKLHKKSKNNKIILQKQLYIQTYVHMYVCIWGTIIKSKAHHDLEANAKKKNWKKFYIKINKIIDWVVNICIENSGVQITKYIINDFTIKNSNFVT